MIKILTNVLTLPNGIHAERWSMIKRAIIDPLLVSNSEISRWVYEVLYKSNKVVIKPASRPRSALVALSGNEEQNQIVIRYPKSEQNKWIRELEVQMYTDRSSTAQVKHRHAGHVDPQRRWLAKLSAGTLGFDSLKSLRLAFPNPSRCESSHILGDLDDFSKLFAYSGPPLSFAVYNLEIVVDGHVCGSLSCSGHSVMCMIHAPLSTVLLQSPRMT